MLAVGLIMKKGTEKSNNPRDIIGIEVCNGNICKIMSVSILHRLLKENPNLRIGVNGSNAYLMPAESMNGVRYIRSEPNLSTVDSLMHLPRRKVQGK